MALRTCIHCGLTATTTAELDLFAQELRAKHGRLNHCKKCRYKNEDRRTQVRRAAMRRLKRNPCMDCKRSYPPECMEFDHIRDKKKFSLSHAVQHMGWAAVLKEIEKCDLVCSNCHKIRTTARARK